MIPYRTSTEGLIALEARMVQAWQAFIPPAALTLSEWADRFAYVPPEAGAFPGKFSTASAEYQRGIQDAITDPSNETIVLMMCSQSGKTQIQLNTVGFYSHHEPSPILFVQASEGEAEKFSKNRVAKMIRVTPVLRKLFPSPRARDSGNTLLNKEFPGGVLILAGANAPAGLASMPIRILIPDEVDRYPESAGTEGDPVDLATRRTTTFWNRKHVMASTPGIKNLSRIEKAYEDSDQRKYFVPCPHCGTMQPLIWARLQYTREIGVEDGRVVNIYYVCEQGCEIREQSKHEMIRQGEWQPTAESRDGKTAGFHLNALYPPWLRWSDLVNEWLSAKNSLERRKTFINTRLAETWEIKGKGAEVGDLEARKDKRNFAEMLPAGVLFLTAGVDVQDDRLEASIWGWGMDEERWVVDHQIFRGDPSLPEVSGGKVNELSPWAKLEEYLCQSWEHELGSQMRVSCALIDSAGHHTARVYEFTRKNKPRRWFSIVGRGGIGKPLINKGSEQGPSKAILYSVGVDTAKEDLYTSLNVSVQGAGYTHFSANLEPEYFRQLTSEKLVKMKHDFVTTLRWVKKGERNETLDCGVYARAAVAVLRPAWKAIQRNVRARAERLAQVGKEESMKPDTDPVRAEEVKESSEYDIAQPPVKTKLSREEKLARAFGGMAVKGRGGWANRW